MDGNTKVRFSVSIGLANCTQEDEFTLDELGYDQEYDEDLEEFLEQEYIEWRNNYLDGNFSLVTEE